jgi:hypothetical protein
MNLIEKKPSLYSKFTFLSLKYFKVLPLFNDKFNLKLLVMLYILRTNFLEGKLKNYPLEMNLTGSKEIVLHTKK